MTKGGMRMEGREIVQSYFLKESGRVVNSSTIYLPHRKNLCKCHNATPPGTIKEKKKRKFGCSLLEDGVFWVT
jgi:hypothetical protein